MIAYILISIAVLFVMLSYYILIVLAVKNGLLLFMSSLAETPKQDADIETEFTTVITAEESIKILRNMRGEQ
jgi:hypothetical protein